MINEKTKKRLKTSASFCIPIYKISMHFDFYIRQIKTELCREHFYLHGIKVQNQITVNTTSNILILVKLDCALATISPISTTLAASCPNL